MVVTYQSDRFAVTDLCHGLDARTSFADTEAFTGKDLLVTLCMQLGETGTKLKLFAVDTQRAVSAFLTLHRIRRQTLRVDT